MAKEKQDFESQLARLQVIVEALESGELALEKSVELYKEGLTLAKQCRGQLQDARNEIRIVSEGVLSDFEGAADDAT